MESLLTSTLVKQQPLKKILFCSGKIHRAGDVDLGNTELDLAASIAFQRAAEQAGIVLMEPIMEVEVSTVAEHLGDVLSDIHSRRGDVVSVTDRARDKVIVAHVPLRLLFGHISDLRSRTRGRVSATLTPSHFAELPSSTSIGLNTQ
ncbi:MAG: hypothetical protein IPK82_43340 [Polyangiaceae bacterium]|nr:hypothetical protein [Polyangiaceae bacterium]